MHAVLPEATFAEVVRHVYESSLLAYRHGHYDPDAVMRVIEDIKIYRGSTPGLGCTFNFIARELAASSARRPGETPQEIRDLTKQSAFRWQGNHDRKNVSLNLVVLDRQDASRLLLWGDTCIFPPATIQAILLGIERILVEAVCDTDLSTEDIRTLCQDLVPSPDPELVRSGGCWIDLADCEELVASAVRPRSLALFLAAGEVAGGGDPNVLEAYIVPAERPLSPASAHRACLTALDGRGHVATPAWYGICDDAPAAGADREAWQRHVVLSGTGRPELPPDL
jgi:hypothetical protein